MSDRVSERMDELEAQRDAVRDLILDDDGNLVSVDVLRERLVEQYGVTFTVQDDGVVAFEHTDEAQTDSRFAETVGIRAYDAIEDGIHPDEWSPLDEETVEQQVEEADALREALEEHRDDLRSELADHTNMSEEELQAEVDDVLDEDS